MGLTYSWTPLQVIRVVTVGAPGSKGGFFPQVILTWDTHKVTSAAVKQCHLACHATSCDCPAASVMVMLLLNVLPVGLGLHGLKVTPRRTHAVPAYAVKHMQAAYSSRFVCLLGNKDSTCLCLWQVGWQDAPTTLLVNLTVSGVVLVC